MKPIKVLIDGDACSVIMQAEKIADSFGLNTVVFADVQRTIHTKHSEVIYVNTGKNAVDMALLDHVEKGDIVITGDYGLAALVMAKCGKSIHPHGFVYTDDNILALLNYNHIMRRLNRDRRKVKLLSQKVYCNFQRDFSRLIMNTLLERIEAEKKQNLVEN